jgi:hypothetical protein
MDGQLEETYITPDLYWESGGDAYTKDTLNTYSAINVSMWAWCCQLDDYSASEVNSYLQTMSQLELLYPGVTFVYMTGNAQSIGADGYNRYLRNEQIRQYCRDNNKVLFDFADLDAWYNGDQATYFYSGQYIPCEHPQYNGNQSGHTTYSSCENKGKALWWLMARLSGWEAPVEKVDILGTWSSSGVWYRDSTTSSWVHMTTPAIKIAAGDIDGDDIDDLMGVWSSGLWVQFSSTGIWARLSAPPLPTAITCGDMNGDGRDDVVGSWSSGTFYRDTLGGGWHYVSTSSDTIAAGDLDGDGTDDLIGVWSSGLWVRNSSSGKWGKLSNPLPMDIACGDMDGDGRDDVLGTWSSGTFYLDTVAWSWVYVSTPASLVAAGDLDGDGTDDLIGTWGGSYTGLWVLYSSTSSWKKICVALPVDIDAGLFRGGSWDTEETR